MNQLGHLGPDLIGHPPPLLTCCLPVVLGKRRDDKGGDDATVRAARMSEDVAPEVHTAELPGGVHQLRAVSASVATG